MSLPATITNSCIQPLDPLPASIQFPVCNNRALEI